MRLSLRRFAQATWSRPLISAARITVMLFSGAATRLRKYLATDSGRTLLFGALSGLYLLNFLHRFWASFGTSLPTVTGVGVAVALGIELAVLSRRAGQGAASANPFGWGFAHFLLAAWLLAFDGLLAAAMQLAGSISAESLARFEMGMTFGCVTGICLLSLPVFIISRFPALRPRVSPTPGSPGPSNSNGSDVPPYFMGLALGLIVGTVVIAPIVGIQYLGLGSALVSGAVFLIVSVQSRRVVAPSSLDGSTTGDDATLATTGAIDPLGGRSTNGLADAAAGIWQIVAITTLGALLASGSRMLDQLTPSAGYLAYCEWGALLAGIAVGARFAQTRSELLSERAARSAACLLVATLAILILACDSLLIDSMLNANAHISFVWGIMAVRVAVGAALFLPIGFAWGGVVGYRLRATGYSWTTNPTLLTAEGQSFLLSRSPALPLSPSPMAFVAGFLMIRLYAVSVVPLAWLVIGASWMLAALAIVNWLPTRQLHRRWFVRVASALAIGVVGMAPLFREMGQGDTAAKLLFATNVFGAKQNNTNARFLPVLDEGRLVANIPGDRGTLTVWKYRGTQLILRESGVPKAVVSTQPEICPEYSPEKMHTILPLVLHEHPHNVLLLGLGGGDGLMTCLSFPVASVTGVEDDRGLFRVLKDVVWEECQVDPLSDSRLRLLQVDPALAVADRRETYDVIISRPDQSALWQSTPYYTLEFYRHAAACLQPDGMFCQRFQQIDLGPEPMRVLARTMQGAFAHVVAIETGMGEIVMLGGNSPDGIVHKGFKERLQRTHVRQALAQMGWDWTVPLNLIAFPQESLAALVAEGPRGLNTAANGRFAFTLPQEVMRWGDKMQQQREVLAPHAIAMLAWPECDFSDPEVLWRLSEVAGRQNLMTKFPDQQWAYRKALRERMEKEKTSIMHQIRRKLEDEELHPQDRQRKDYLVALGKAASDPAPTREKIDAVASFAEPFDPLLSYFIHHEVAELLKRAPEHDSHDELMHRLHLAYYADGRDQSVRNVAAAIDLLAKNDEGTFGPVERFDQMNALLQMMKIRWETRGVGKAKSVQYMLNDVDKSVSAVERSFAEMDKLATDLNMPGIDWPARRDYLETTLVRPLRSYRQELTALHLKQKQRTEEVLSRRKNKKSKSEDLLPVLGN